MGAVLGTLGLAGPVFALIEQPQLGWGHPVIIVTLVGGLARWPPSSSTSGGPRSRCCRSRCSRQRNFAVGNASTLAIYGGLGASPFFLGSSSSRWAATTPSRRASPPAGDRLMFLLSRRFGALADRWGPRLFMGAGPVVAGAGIALFARPRRERDYVRAAAGGSSCSGSGSR